MSRRRDDEDGAIAVMAALFTTTLLLMAAFSVDMGMAYTSRMALQTAADAGSLAAAATYAEASTSLRTCEQLRDSGPRAAAQQAAADHLRANASSLTTDPQASPLQVTCEDGALRVAVEVKGETPTFFGRLADVEAVGGTRRASAAVEVSPGSLRVRPLAVCSADLPADPSPGVVWTTGLPGSGQVPSTTCPQPKNAGDWWTLDCPEEFDPNADLDGGGTPQLIDQISDGCRYPVTVVAGQGVTTGSVLGNVLRTSCPGPAGVPPYTCLSGDPGQPDAGHAEDAWRSLVDQSETLVLPVFCASSACGGSTVMGEGTNAVFPVQRLVSVTLCGFHFGKQDATQYARTAGACRSATTQAAQLLADDASTRNYLLLVSTALVSSGSTVDHDCALGSASCDGGLRRVRMVE